MPLTILLPMVIIGIAGIAVLLHLLGLSKPSRLDGNSALAAWLREFPDDTPTGIITCQNQCAALIDIPQGHGIVWPMGADFTARYLSGAKINRTVSGLRIDLPDVTAPHIHLALDAAEADVWVDLLKEPA